jgi:porphobilinogen synthase
MTPCPVTTPAVVIRKGHIFDYGAIVSQIFPVMRPRRLRRTTSLRTMFQETAFSLDSLILPIFVEEGIDDFQEIRSMPGVMRIPEARLAGQIERYARAGVRSIMTFGVSHNKDAIGSDTWLEHGLTARIARTNVQGGGPRNGRHIGYLLL